MKAKASFVLTMTLILIGTIILAWKTSPVKASGTIHIRADGSVDPPTPQIMRYGDVYTLTGDISIDADGIYIERSNMTLEGAGYTIRGSGIGVGVLTGSDAHNLTIKDTNIENFYYGIFSNATNTVVSRNNITGNAYGVMLYGYSRTTVSENRLANNTYHAIDVGYTSNNAISANTIEYNGDGIDLFQSTNNTIQGNNIQASAYSGISLIFSSSNNQIFRNIIRANNYAGIAFNGTDSVNNVIFENNLISNTWGMWSYISNSNNKIWHNSFVNNTNQVFNSNFGNISVNTWDDGYPSGGNYWTNYNGTDSYSGPYQNVTGSDGIGDTQQFIDLDNTDRYPLIGHFTRQGQNVTVSPRSDIDLTFANITAPGQTTATENATGPAPPSGFNVAGQYFDVKTTASYSGKITLRFNYDDSGMSQVVEENLRLFHWNTTSSQWEDITTHIDTAGNVVWGETTSLSIFTTHSIQPLDQDIVVAKESCNKSVVGQGYAAAIDVTLRNSGGTTKTFDVNVYVHATATALAGTQTVTSLGGGQKITLRFIFQTSDLPKGNYTIIVGDNQTGWIILAMVGDVSGIGTFPDTLPDGKIDIKDLAAIAKVYGVNYPDPRYVANYDLTGLTLGLADGKIDIRDLAAAAKNYGKNDP